MAHQTHEISKHLDGMTNETLQLARGAVLYAWPLYEMRRMRASASFSFIEGVGDTGDDTR